MKKFKSKIVTFALALCLIVPCMFMLTACGDDHTHTLTKVDAVAETCTTDGNTLYYKCDCGKYFSDEEAKTEIEKDSWIVEKTGHTYASTWTYNETHHWKEATCGHSTEKGDYAEHSLTDNACECGYVANTYTVSEADWNSVLTGDYLTNGTINMEINGYENDVISSEDTGSQIMKSSATAMEMTMIYDGQSETQYLVKDGEQWYAIEKVGDVWYGVEYPADSVASYTFAGSIATFLVDNYDSFTYDDVNHCYVAEDYDIGMGTYDFVKLYFENNKIVKIELKVTEDATTYTTITYNFSDYGTTTIDVPQWSVAPQNSYTVTDNNEWNEVFTGDYLTNGTINIANNLYVEDVIDQEQSSSMTMKSTETSMVMIMVEGTETLYQYLVNEEDGWYALSQVEDVWYGAAVTNELVGSFTFAGGQGVYFEDRLSEFTYDEENHCYVANDFNLDVETTADTVKIYIENGKLVKMEIKVPVTTDSYGMSEYVFSDYGTTTIDVPEWTLVTAGE